MTMLDTPAQISMWVLLSRRHQIALHTKGLTVKGLVACLKREFPEAHGRTAKDFIVPVEFAISQAGGDIDYSKVNVHIMLRAGGMLHDRGIFANMDEAGTPENRRLFAEGKIECVLTLDAPREPSGGIFVAE